MAIGLQKNNTKIGVKEESTEGVFEAVAAATDFIQPTEDFSVTPAKELKERTILTSGLSRARSRVSTRSSSASVNIEQRASGLEGGAPDSNSLLKATLGGRRQLLARVTTKAGNGASQLEIEDADIGSFSIGDTIVVLESGNHHVSAVTAVDPTGGAANITLLIASDVASTVERGVAKVAAFSDNVEIAKFTTYFPENDISNFPSLSMSFYHGDEILEKAFGMRVASMALSNFTTGEIATWDFSLEGTDFDEEDGSAAFSPAFDDSTPPLILNACIAKDGVYLDLNEFSFSIENAISFITSTCSESGRIGSRFGDQRTISGSLNPYKDDVDVSLMDNFKDNDPFSLFAFSGNPSAVDGEFELGSVIGYYMPSNILSSKVVADVDGVLVDNLEYQSDGGSAGEDKEFFLSLI